MNVNNKTKRKRRLCATRNNVYESWKEIIKCKQRQCHGQNNKITVEKEMELTSLRGYSHLAMIRIHLH